MKTREYIISHSKMYGVPVVCVNNTLDGKTFADFVSAEEVLDFINDLALSAKNAWGAQEWAKVTMIFVSKTRRAPEAIPTKKAA